MNTARKDNRNPIARSFKASDLSRVLIHADYGMMCIPEEHREIIMYFIKAKQFDADIAWITLYFCECSNEVWVFVHRSHKANKMWLKYKNYTSFESKCDNNGNKYVRQEIRKTAHYIFTI
jgi:hypothetical protein